MYYSRVSMSDILFLFSIKAFKQIIWSIVRGGGCSKYDRHQKVLGMQPLPIVGRAIQGSDSNMVCCVLPLQPQMAPMADSIFSGPKPGRKFTFISES